MASIYRTSYIYTYVVIFCRAHILNFFVGCHCQIIVQLVSQVHFQKSIVGLSLSLNKNVQCKFAWTQFVVVFDVANESFNIPLLNSLNLCQHRIGTHRDIAGMYRPMLMLV